MNEFLNKAVDLCTAAGGKLVLALLVFIIGRIVISKLLHVMAKVKGLEKLDPSVRSFALNFVKVLLNLLLVLSIISILGVPMASVVTVLATAGVAVGMSLQGSLSNLAGGIMLMIFRPFNVGDFVSTAGADGVVKEITLFYTVMTTPDNCRVIVPNGSLMNANVTNFSCEPQRRVDLLFSCAKGEDVKAVQQLMIDVMDKNPQILKDPAPFASLSGGTNESMDFTVRAWCSSADYWDVYFALTQDITVAMGNAGIHAPAVRVISEAPAAAK